MKKINHKIIAKRKTATGSKPVAKLKPAVKSKPAIKSLTKSKSVIKPVIKLKPAIKPVVKLKPVVKPKPVTKLKPVAKSKPVTKPKPAIKSVTKPKPAVKPVPRPMTKHVVKPTVTKPTSKPVPKPVTKRRMLEVFQWTSELNGAVTDFVTVALSPQEAIAAAGVSEAKAWYLDVCYDQRVRDMAMNSPGTIFVRNLSENYGLFEQYNPPKEKKR